MTNEARTNALRAVLSIGGGSWIRLVDAAVEVILFGSHAVGVADSASDWDILCVGGSKGEPVRGVDLIWKSSAEVRTSKWLGSELAAHVRDYGVWLRGSPTWADGVSVNQETIGRKQKMIMARSASASSVWALLSEDYRNRYRTKVRRDVQRLTYLKRGAGPPPRPVLDTAWAASPDISRWWRAAKLEGAPPDLWPVATPHLPDGSPTG